MKAGAWAAGVAVVLAAIPAPGERLRRRVASALRIEERIVVDGRLDEPAWGRAPALDGFVQQEPEFGPPASQETRAFILFDEEAIYVGFDCRDTSAEEILAPLARRDQMPRSDRVFVFIDGLHDGRSGFEFTVSAGGVLSDAARARDTGRNHDWDGVWTGAAARDRGGWTAEIRVPFRILRYREGERVWGLQLRRVVGRNREVSQWQPIPPSSGTFVSAFGELHNADGDLLGQDNELSAFVVFHNMWSASIGLRLDRAHVDDRESREGPDFRVPTRLAASAGFDTDFAKPVFGGAGTWIGRRVDAPAFTQWCWVTVRPVDAVELSLSASVVRAYGFTRYVDTETDAAEVDHYVFASADLTELNLTFRGLLVLTRDLTFQLYAQAIRSIWDHSDPRELLEDRTLVPFDTDDDDDLDTTGVSAQLVLRWEIWPGSAAFLVFRHELSTNAVPSSGSLSDGRDPFLAHLLDQGDSVVLAKLTLLWWP